MKGTPATNSLILSKVMSLRPDVPAKGRRGAGSTRIRPAAGSRRRKNFPSPSAAPNHRHSGMKLSIVIPCYNEAKTIRTIVDRVRASPVKDREIIIVDDCSRDGTRDLLRTQIAPL